jgi:hypothetical protein
MSMVAVSKSMYVWSFYYKVAPTRGSILLYSQTLDED